MGRVARLLAPGIFGAEMGDTGQPVALHPQEEPFVAKAAPKRRRDFALGRACARAALAQLGHGQVPIGMAEGGAPLWPAGILGSITHTKNYAAALAAEARLFSGVGVDAERLGGVTQDLWPRLFDAAERDHLMGLDSASRMVFATMIFSAKEACYKAWGLKGALVFRDIHVVPEDGGFTATRSGEVLHGRAVVEGDLVLTAAWF
jgi:phosphopantetheine--protein transferase-like protein